MENAEFARSFEQGLAAYQAKDFAKAQEHFAQAIELDPGNAAAMVNYAFSLFESGQKGASAGWLRKALQLDPGNTQAKQGLKFVTSKLEIKEIPHRIEFYETFRASTLTATPLSLLLAVTAMLLLSFGWFLIGWLGQRRRDLQNEIPTPFPLKIAVLGVLWVALSSLTVLKAYDGTVRRATVVASPVEVKSAPTANSVTLFNLYEGLEVILHSTTQDWARVTYPGGMTGWVPLKTVLDHGSSAR